jgi:hypothetical protein
MKTKVLTDGKQYKLLVKKFPFLWWTDELQVYESLEQTKSAAFRVYGITPQEFMEQNGHIAQQR